MSIVIKRSQNRRDSVPCSQFCSVYVINIMIFQYRKCPRDVQLFECIKCVQQNTIIILYCCQIGLLYSPNRADPKGVCERERTMTILPIHIIPHDH